jgi:hypothetical protein
VFAALTLVLGACSAGTLDYRGDGGSATPPSRSGPSGGGTSYKGEFTGSGGDGGSIDLTVNGTQVSGTLHLPSGSVPVSGSSSGSGSGTAFTFSGGGYNFNASSAGDTITGSYNGPKGDGSFTLLSSGGGGATTYCGTFSGTQSGVWNVTVSGSNVSGSYTATSAGVGGTLSGSVGGSNMSLSASGGVTATGTISGASVSGSWSAPGENGTWTGSSGGCGS